MTDRKNNAGDSSADLLNKKQNSRLSLEAGISRIFDRITELAPNSPNPIIVEIAGGSGSGKTTKIASKLKEKFKDKAILISIDDYFIGASRINARGLNFDHPDAVDLDLLKEHLRLMKEGKVIEKPIYEFKTGERTGNERVNPKRIIILEGIFALNKKVAGEGDVRVFVDVGSHGRIMRRLMRDSKRDNLFSVPMRSMQYMTNVVEPMYGVHIAPTRQNADIIIDNDYNPHQEAGSAGVLEIQRKYRASVDPEALRKIGASRLSSVNQTDYYYVPQDGSFASTKEMIRIRKENKSTVFTYKGPKLPNNYAVERYKFEFEIDRKTEQGISSVYVIKPKVITKDRTLYFYNGLIFGVDTCVCKTEGDNTTELGDFVEVTVPQSKSGIRALNKLLSSLKIDSADIILKSYDEM